MFGNWQEKADELLTLIRDLIEALRDHTAELKRHRQKHG